MKLRNNYFLILILTCIAIFFVNLDAIYVNIMEARNFITAREMVDLDHWIFTTMNDEPRYEKPPLPTWLTAISMMLFGMKSLFALRLPAAIMGTIGVLGIYKIGDQITGNKKFGFISALIAATSFYILYSGRDGQWDIHTHAWMVLAIIGFFKIFSENSKAIGTSILVGICLGFSFLSKGPVSMYALLLPFLIAYGCTFKFKKVQKKWPEILILVLIAFLISASWSWYVYYFDTKHVMEITNTEAGRWIDYNVRPFYYYWSFFIQSGIWTIPAFISLLYPYLKNRVFHKKGYQFTLLWTLASVVLLSIIPEKKSRYLLPVLIPLALNTGFYIEFLFRSFKNLNNKERWPVYFNFGLIALIGIIFPFAGYYYFQEKLEGMLVWFVLTAISLLFIGIFILFFLKKKEFNKVFYLTIEFTIAIIFFGFPMAKKIEVNPYYTSITEVDKIVEGRKWPLFEYESFSPEMVWEYGKPVERLHENENLKIPEAENFLLLATEEQEEEIRRQFWNYRIQKVMEIDMNPVGNKHKGRLYRDLYKLEKQ
ncbi:glycosyltransferase family 39 protein [Gramella sp. AN32]|uniref:ArnT family glycosyltransferase n=1 Tax=Christiangramia antarctica TaxID=2058158 RepID=A0ABW5X525_9FLAO|nr:glycosyltransferase family 39 protein [Gramella sp. AN32]MCM4156198.1 hypothetical protein [Gramella sp. AN32]